MLGKSLTIQLKHLSINSLDKGKFTLNILHTIVCEAISVTVDSRTVSNMNVSCNFERNLGQVDLYPQLDWLYEASEGELLTLKHSFQNFVISTMEHFNYSKLKSTHTLSFTTAVLGNNLAVISYGIIGDSFNVESC
ncbi:hypothetical protein AGENTSMITH_205 [Bacillus phage vB_BspM_AgentSmith]|nr:hypothetical protein AGENTSMITH_205 [Bacillus phage vB_BspM_AgentSmith]